MSREDGFAVADTDTGLLSDPKVLALARLLRDSIQTAAALTLYDAVRLGSWRAGTRLTLDETVPGWWLDPWEELAAALVTVKLLDADRRIPAHAWEGWFGPARDRRDRFRQLGSRGGSAKARNASEEPRSSERSSARSSARSSPSVRPSVPTVPSPPADGAGVTLTGSGPSFKERVPLPPAIRGPGGPTKVGAILPTLDPVGSDALGREED